MLGALRGNPFQSFTVEAFPTRSAVWQLLQNLTTYCIVASLAHLHAIRAQLASRGGQTENVGQRPLSRYFIRTGDEFKPVDVQAIIRIAGADDYAEVHTTGGTHLARRSLADFAATLDPVRFVRVHRSHIVNAERIASAESAGGGRLLLHMEDGGMVTTSRTGARMLRAQVI